ncbi:hypothetical protein [Mycobacterium heckeshornense]|uniref:hypothetical protein n=1 Tax=Mycobacterium heckeshornense TaxID=110505 RepID=UPI001944B5F5|nr:hypothetical protein [Mycobacterium heckeshornense]
MPADEGVAAGKWDGTVRSEGSNAWVPDGLSVWELSVDKSPNVKADDDYGKRHTTPDGSPVADATYVELIVRHWNDRTDWAKGRRDEKKWRDVRAYGLDDVQAWLETAPVTWAWFSEQVGLNPYGQRTASTWWNAWSQQTSPTATPELVLAGRAEIVAAIERLISKPGTTTLEGASLDEVCAVLAAIAVYAESMGDSRIVSRLIFVDEQSAWRQLLESPQPLILIPLDPEFARQVPTDTPHTVLVPISGPARADMKLPPLDAHGVATALQAAGMTDARKAEDLGRLARRSLTALRRNLANNSALHRPPWATSPVPRHVRATLLAGGWSAATDGDKSIIEALSGDSYDSFSEKAAALSVGSDPLLARLGASWNLVSPFDTWLLLAEQLTADDMSRFQAAVMNVLGEQDPALDLPEDQRWRATFEGKVRAFSPVLRRALAASVALLGVHGAAISFGGGGSGTDWANSLVRSILQRANADAQGRVWASISDLLPFLAEGGPDAFLDAVNVGLSSDNPTLATMFTDKSDRGPFAATSPHVGLLWALEALAWSPTHFGAVIDALARLDEVDPGGRLGNRPFGSLAAIFRPWHPETSVNAARRLRVIERLRKRHNTVAWKLMMSVLPSHMGEIHSATNEPKYQDWKQAQYPVSQAEYFSFISDIVQDCVNEAGTDGTRWRELLEHYSELAPNDREHILAGLTTIVDADSLSAEDRVLLWNYLRDMVAMHREYSEAKWALPSAALATLDGVVQRLQPRDAYNQHEWLFQDHLPTLDDIPRRENHQEYQQLLSERRRDAIAAIEQEGGLRRVQELAKSVEVSAAVGTALAEACPTYDDELLESTVSAEAVEVELAAQYYGRRFRQGGWTWLENFLKNHPEATDLQRARLLLVTTDFPKAWEVADQHGGDVPELFWRNFSPYGLGSNLDNKELIADRLMHVGRNATALHFIRIYFDAAPEGDPALAELIAKGLDGIVASGGDKELLVLRQYDFAEFFEILEKAESSLGRDRVARLEWNCLPALGHEPRVHALEALMAENPEFFVEVVRAVYSPEAADSSDTSEGQRQRQDAMARNGYSLLSSWKHPPGLVNDAIVPEQLKAWFDAVMELLTESDRVGAAQTHIGQVLAFAPPDSDGVWPPEVVREFLEEVRSDKLENGLLIAILNQRGVTSRGLEEGGEQEEKLADKYQSQAEQFADQWPRTSALLRAIAGTYDADARRNEESAERFRRGLE